MVSLESEAHKRRRLLERSLTKSSPSKIFQPFRTIGLVTDGTPFAVTSLGQTFLITTVVDRVFNIYDASSLQLLFVSSPLAPSKITCIHSHFHHVFAGWGHTVGIFKRGRLEQTLELAEVQSGEDAITNILLLGQYLCVSTDKALYVYQVDLKDLSRKPELHVTYRVPSVSGNIKQLLHLPTYLNKIFIVTENVISVYNVRSGKTLFTTDEFGSSIVSVEPAPVLDVVAVATSNGALFLYNIKNDKIIYSLDTGVKVTSLSFRTDGIAHLAIGTLSGDILFYDLNTRRRIHTVRGTHSGSRRGVSSVHFLNGQSIVVSNGADNLLHELVFDPAITTNTSITAPPRYLRSRGGHALPPSSLEFTDEEAHFILSASQDQTLWSFSLRKDSQSHQFSQRTGNSSSKNKNSLSEKFPEITALAYQANKQNRWDNIVTAHRDLTFARSWSGKRGIVGKYQLHSADGSIVKSVAISGCGNFALIGSATGGISIYNLQSGLCRKKILKAHTATITGITVDNLNTTVVTCSLDGFVKFFDFKTGKLMDQLDLSSSVTQLRLHSRSSLIAVASDNLLLTIIDITTRKVVRVFAGHYNRITSFDFTPDARWIISAGLDKTIRTWDLPIGGCIDVVKVAKLATCLRVSPNGEWIATSHVQDAGIQLWSQKSQFAKMLSLRLVNDDDDIATIEMPNLSGQGGSNLISGALDDEDLGMDAIMEGTGKTTVGTMDQISKDLVTLSLMPRTKLNSLVNLEAIKLRNKPKEAPQKPKAAPFFLGSADKLKSAKESSEDNKSSDKLNASLNGQFKGESLFTALLRGDDSVAFITHLKSLSPAATDLEIRSLDTLPPYSELISFISAMVAGLDSGKDYELIQAWMFMLLKIHGDVIVDAVQKEDDAAAEQLCESLQTWQILQSDKSSHLDDISRYCAGVLNYIRSS